MDSPSHELIVGTVGAECVEPLEALGVRSILDITCLRDEDLQRVGLSIVQIRKLQMVAGGTEWSLWNTPSIAEPPGLSTAMELPPPSLGPPSCEELEKIQDALTVAEQKAIESLDISAEESLDVAQCVLTAREQLSQHPNTPVLAIHAENAVIRALSHCPLGTSSRKQLEEAQRCIRDVIVLRLQKEVPLGSRSIFIKAMETAYGVCVGAMPGDALAKLMHAHSQVVCPLFPHAFVSISRKENAARRHGPRGKRTRDVRRVAALAADLGDLSTGLAVPSASSGPTASSGLATPLPGHSSNDTILPPPGLHIIEIGLE